MFNIKTMNKISPLGLNLFGDNYSISGETEKPEAILVRSASLHDTEFDDSLLAIGRAGAGVNNIPVDKCSEKGIVVFNTPGANANAVKELAIAGLLLSSRRVVDGINWAKSLIGEGDMVPKLIEKGKGSFVGPEIYGKTLGVVGLGAIGVMFANAAEALGMSVIGYDPYISVDSAWGLSRRVAKATDFKALLDTCDYMSIHVPLTPETKGMINAEVLGSVKKGVRILNFARSDLVDNIAMKEALENGNVGVYVTDFPDELMLKTGNVIAIPHLGASTPESEENCAVMASKQIKDYLENGNIFNSVNFPNCVSQRSGQVRITILHSNIPNMLNQISSILAKDSINISEMSNKSKKNVAYTMIDLDCDVPDNVISELEAINSVIKVRVIK